MGTDARTRYTRMVIKRSFIRLLADKPLGKVTVKELCELSEVSRATFYKYYDDPFDLLDKLEEECLDELRGSVRASADAGFKDAFTQILAGIEANGEAYRTLFSEHGDPHFPSRILDALYAQSIPPLGDEALAGLPPHEQRWLYYFVAQGCSSILAQWIAGGMAEPVDEVAEFADDLVRSARRSAARRAHRTR
ncbi:TetR/AcrR family transcriptional regulator [Arabiibacter massiliensis]|uniref:TetR/AcrR family transcriptional regulator n=1 Tax=Arabiibacter massiliensis TaxID=1870985 RepID=UPI0009BC3AE1|nr:TetR/AcrR family transcriptional regulator [Arabiibacter massiliensis]